MSTSRQFNQAFLIQGPSSIGNMFITGGNIGINNTSPTTTLDISGSLRITGGSFLATNNSNTLGNLWTTGGNVGINTTNPSYNLDITGTCRSILTNGTAVLVGGPTATYDPCLILLNSQGSLQLGIASMAGSYANDASLGDGVIRSAPGDKLLLQCGIGESTLCVSTNGNVGIRTTSQNTRLSITPSTVEAKITFFQHPTSGNHYGFGVSNGQLNYHVPGTTDDHVFWFGGKNGNGTELLRIKGTGSIISSNFTTTNVYNNSNIGWHDVNSSNFTVGTGTKLLNVNFSWYSSVSGLIRNIYIDIYTSTNTLVTTLSQPFYFNQTYMHTSGTYTNIISNATMGPGTYYLKFRHDTIADGNDYMRATIITFPF